MADLTSATAVAEYLALDEDGALKDDTYLERTVSAVNSWLAEVLDNPVDGAEWPAHLQHGATMMAATIWRRRSTPDGVTAFGDMATFVARYDPDAMKLLGLGEWRIPKVR